MISERRRTGNLGEDLACAFLIARGYSVLARNFSIARGEIDIIAQKGSTIHFVEVKAVSREMNLEPGTSTGYRPEELVHTEKVRKIRAVGEFYLVSREMDHRAQVDVVAVEMEKSSLRAFCRLIEHVESL
ncbi:MAG: YraN family protein [Candidatus Pacebacteria bacterium]|nr:YraN family protein [Candidatus Paceibacterota bacterium]